MSMSPIPPVTCVEPVYPTADSEQSFWVYCDAHWDEERGVFVNREAGSEWELDEYSYLDSVYMVGEDEYTSMDAAMRAALGDELYAKHDPHIVAEPTEGHSPEWGPEA